ncbi:MAG: diaminopimelate epimerase [Bacteroidales bacterium]|nr:diaminopimelate epimerase [Bacteroidales bacterium]
MQTIRFTKMHGAGNDYIYIDGITNRIPADIPAFAKRYSERHKGIGADGVVVILPSDVAHCRMKMFNADGSEGQMCGNALRCVAKYTYEHIMIHRTEMMLIDTESGIKVLNLKVRDGKVQSVSVQMGKPSFNTAKLPMNIKADEFIDQPIATSNGTQYNFTAVSMGNPHIVTFLDDDIRNLDLNTIGPNLECNKLFPERVNTEFINIIDSTHFRMRVWERGSGETLACGTGACAAVVAAVKNGIANRDTEITVELLGGSLFITYHSDDNVTMRGEAIEVFTGIMEIE